jgi:hypothetical protein
MKGVCIANLFEHYVFECRHCARTSWQVWLTASCISNTERTKNEMTFLVLVAVLTPLKDQNSQPGAPYFFFDEYIFSSKR